ncbi:MAG: TetR family transcriptional regulator [Gammaproteobacteria bacterium]|nr:TetR family transcriptional regulator [Gammaproteobacteria bacterium]
MATYWQVGTLERMSATTTTAERILDSAEDLLQRRGYHAFSFRDVAACVGVRACSLSLCDQGHLGRGRAGARAAALRRAIAGAGR